MSEFAKGCIVTALATLAILYVFINVGAPPSYTRADVDRAYNAGQRDGFLRGQRWGVVYGRRLKCKIVQGGDQLQPNYYCTDRRKR